MAGMFLESPVITGMNIAAPGLIETMHSTEQGDIPLLARHLRRLRASAQALLYPCPLPEIKNELLASARQHRGQAQRLRLLLHPGGWFELNRQPLVVQEHVPAVVLAATRLHVPDLWLHHKTTHRPLYRQAGVWLQSHPDCFDCIFLNQHHQLCEGSRSNVYLQLDGHWYTPPLECGVLPGILRETLLESGEVREQILHLDDLMSAQGIRMSNAVHGWRDVRFDKTGTPQNFTTNAAP